MSYSPSMFTAAINVYGGNGALGTTSLSGPTLDSSPYNYVSLTLSGTTSCTTGVLHIKCTGNFTNSGTINVTATNPGGAGGTASNVPAPAGCGAGGLAGGGGGGLSAEATYTTSGDGGGLVPGNAARSPPYVGSTPAAGGTAPSVPSWVTNLGWGALIMLPGGGGGGGGGGTSSFGSSGGAGGNGGGLVVIEARGSVTEGTINADATNGTAGGALGTNGAGGGGGGGGGTVYVGYGTTNTTGTISVAAGSGGAGGNSTGDGSAGGSGATGVVYRLKVI